MMSRSTTKNQNIIEPIDYSFYKVYTTDTEFLKKFVKRIQNLKAQYKLSGKTNDEIVRQYFVEIFSWSVFTPHVLNILSEIFKKHKITQVLDPCAGSAFHTFLINSKLGIDVRTVDIQDETDSWLPIEEMDGRKLLQELSSKEHKSSALLLSWVDYESLTIELLEEYQGKMVISVGNYEGNSLNYLQMLEEKYKLKKRIILQMPWNLEEKIEIYLKK